MANDQEKEAAARASLRFVKDGQVVGLGTGSTAAYFIQLLGEQVKNGLRIRGIPSSERSREQAAGLGIPVTTLDECPQIDVTVDGADEVDPQLRLIKGGGGALLREKIVASATRQLVIVADATKRVPVLGRFPLPVEVIKFAQAVVVKKIEALGAAVGLRRGADGNWNGQRGAGGERERDCRATTPALTRNENAFTTETQRNFFCLFFSVTPGSVSV
jgi:ribose 5-phosphate isomerase A